MHSPIPRSIEVIEGKRAHVQIVDQRYLPHETRRVDLHSSADCEHAIREMLVRGAPLIGITAAFGVYFSTMEELGNGQNRQEFLEERAAFLKASRPTAVNLAWAVDKMLSCLEGANEEALPNLAWKRACELMEEDANLCRRIGEFGLSLIQEIAKHKDGEPVNILTHCNAGSLACIEWGTATSPIYQAHLSGIPVHVWVDETRPRNQGAHLTAWELGEAGVPHTLVVDNAGGHLMQHGQVDLVLVGADRVSRNGDAANKIGTYLKALAANDNHVPFYVCLPSSTLDWNIADGVKEIEIEERTPDEVRFIQGSEEGSTKQVLICPENTPAFNVGFDVTPARLITGLITDKGICQASEKGLKELYDREVTE